MRNLFIAIFLFSSALPAEERVVGGPFVVNVSGRTATIGWVVQTQEARVGESPDALTRTAPVLRSEKVSFTGLPQGKTIYYDVLNGLPEGKGSFRTPPQGTGDFEAVVFGDTRTRHDLHKRVIEAILKFSDPAFVLHTGDLVTDGFDSAQWTVFFDIERELLRKAAFYPVLGNHERNNYKYHDFFEVQSPYYSFNWGAAHIAVLNSDLGNVAPDTRAREEFWDAQRRWLEEDLQNAAKATYRVVVLHNPPFTGTRQRQAGGGNVFARTLIPLLEKYKVHVVFNGHDHNYQHHLFGGVHYVVTGGGGAPLYPVDGPMEGITQKMVSTEHFVRWKVSAAGMKVEAVGLDGILLDSFDAK